MSSVSFPVSLFLIYPVKDETNRTYSSATKPFCCVTYRNKHNYKTANAKIIVRKNSVKTICNCNVANIVSNKQAKLLKQNDAIFSFAQNFPSRKPCFESVWLRMVDWFIC